MGWNEINQKIDTLQKRVADQGKEIKKLKDTVEILLSKSEKKSTKKSNKKIKN